MKDMLVPIDKAGRVVLPKHLREELAINPGDMLEVSIRGNEVTLRPNKMASGLVRRGQALVFSNGGGDLLHRETVDAILAEGRQGRIAEITGAVTSRRRKS